MGSGRGRGRGLERGGGALGEKGLLSLGQLKAQLHSHNTVINSELFDEGLKLERFITK